MSYPDLALISPGCQINPISINQHVKTLQNNNIRFLYPRGEGECQGVCETQQYFHVTARYFLQSLKEGGKCSFLTLVSVIISVTSATHKYCNPIMQVKRLLFRCPPNCNVHGCKAPDSHPLE